MHLEEPQFTYSVCVQFTENKEKIKEKKKKKKQEILDIFIKTN